MDASSETEFCGNDKVATMATNIELLIKSIN